MTFSLEFIFLNFAPQDSHNLFLERENTKC